MDDAKRDLSFVSETGALGDLALVRSIQKNINSGANEAFTFGHFEPTIVHLNQHLSEQIAGLT